ncbi:MAG: hypothetical protein GY696_11890 [Gammaproteobacteria bacterium]|nr:hypothetical protein [Gammaproteobacteria bacterium]
MPNNFLANLFEDVLQIVNTKHIKTSGYASQTNGLVERLNRMIPNLLAHYVSKDQTTWDRHLPLALMAAHVNPQESTKESPLYLLYGQDALLPLDAAFDYYVSPYVDAEDLPYSEQLQWRLSTAWRKAQENIGLTQQRNPPTMTRRPRRQVTG